MGIIGRLNKKNKERKIIDMDIGESGYTLPWALMFDKEEVPYLNIQYPIESKRGGTLQLPIKRTGPGLEDYEINITKVNYQWDLTDNNLINIFGGSIGDCVRLSYQNDQHLNPVSNEDIEEIIKKSKGH